MVGKVVVLSIVILYIYIYTRPKRNIELLQTDITSFDPEHLFEKQPILIFSEIVDKKDFIQVSFKYQYMFQNETWVAQNTAVQNTSKFALLYNDTNDDMIIRTNKRRTKAKYGKIYHYVFPEDYGIPETAIKIILKPHNILVLPYLFEYTASKDLKVNYMTDIFHTISP